MTVPRESSRELDPMRPVGQPEAGRFPGPWMALCGYVVLTVVLTWPLAARIGGHLPAGDNDLWQNYWNFWWWSTALVERGQSPYETDLLYQPGIVSLAFHTHSEASILTTFPILVTAGVPAAVNVATLLGFLFAGLGGYLLARELVRNRSAAFLAGVVVAFFPHHFEQSLEHINLASYHAMPFFLLFLVRLVRYGGWHHVLLVALAFALNCLYSWHNGLLILPLALALFLRELHRTDRSRLRVLTEATVAGVVATILLLPFLWPMLREILAGETYFIKPQVQKGVDPVFLVIPPAEHTVWGNLVAPLYEKYRAYAAVGFTCYLGWVALALWITGGVLIVRRRRAQTPFTPTTTPGVTPGAWVFWSSVLLGFVLLALGDPLVVLGKETGLRLPFAFVREIPGLKTLRVANRFIVPAMMALSMLVAMGSARLLASFPRRRALLFGLLVTLLVVDNISVPYPTRPLPSPEWTRAVASCPKGLLLDVPGSYRARAAEDMFFQTLHGRPLVGGYTSCIPPWIEDRVRQLPFLRLVFEGRPPPDVLARADDEKILRTDLEQVLDALPIGVVVIHKDRTREGLERLHEEHLTGPLSKLYNPEKGIPAAILDRIRATLEALWGRPRYEDDSVALYGRPEP